MVPQHAAGQGWMKSAHWRKGSWQACSLSWAGMAQALRFWSAWSISLQRISMGWERTACPNHVLRGWEGGRLFQGTWPLPGGLVSSSQPFLASEEVSRETSFYPVQQLCAEDKAAARALLEPLLCVSSAGLTWDHSISVCADYTLGRAY